MAVELVSPKAVEKAKKELQHLVEEQLKAGTPLQLVCDYLDEVEIERLDVNLVRMTFRGPAPLQQWATAKVQSSIVRERALSEVKHDLANVLVKRNLDGKKLEEQGKTPKAIALYEANVADLFRGTHPYDRLRIIYTKAADYANAARVCRAFINVPVHHGRPDQETRKKFLDHYEKLVKRAT